MITRPLSLRYRLWVPALMLLAAIQLRGDTITLTDGTKLQGKAIKQGEQYWVKTTDGESRFIPVEKVQSVQRGEAADTAPVKSEPTAPKPGTSAAYLAARQSAESAVFAEEAAHIWKEFVKAHPDSPDLASAQAEAHRWSLMKDAEKIRGAWVRGPELADAVKRARESVKEGVQFAKEGYTAAAIGCFRDAVRIYPNDYQANYTLGYISLSGKQNESAIELFEQALRVRPQSVGAMNNLAVAYFETRKFEGALAYFVRAAQNGDDALLARNLAAALQLAPAAKVSIARWKEAQAASEALTAKYKLKPEDAATSRFWLQPPAEAAAARGGSGTGFVVTPFGLIVTNRHVALGASKITVRMTDGKEYDARIVKVDEKQDLAILRVDAGKDLPYLPISGTDLPSEAAQCLALGFPMGDLYGGSIKITQGIVSSITPGEPIDILTDAKINPGNSGGPLLNLRGEVIGVVTAKTVGPANAEHIDSYGMAISAGKLREFLKSNLVHLPSTDASGPLSTEAVVAKAKPATVYIHFTRGETEASK